MEEIRDISLELYEYNLLFLVIINNCKSLEKIFIITFSVSLNNRILPLKSITLSAEGLEVRASLFKIFILEVVIVEDKRLFIIVFEEFRIRLELEVIFLLKKSTDLLRLIIFELREPIELLLKIKSILLLMIIED